jgi:hypothetical protein
MPAYLYHWSVLRCGIPVTEHGYVSTQPKYGTACPALNVARVAYQATRDRSPHSECTGNGRSRDPAGSLSPGEQHYAAALAGNAAA